MLILLLICLGKRYIPAWGETHFCVLPRLSSSEDSSQSKKTYSPPPPQHCSPLALLHPPRSGCFLEPNADLCHSHCRTVTFKAGPQSRFLSNSEVSSTTSGGCTGRRAWVLSGTYVESTCVCPGLGQSAGAIKNLCQESGQACLLGSPGTTLASRPCS